MEQNTQVLCVNWGDSVPTTPRWMLHLPTALYGCGAAIIPSSVDVPVNSIARLCSFWRITCWLIKQCVCNIRIALLQMASSPTLQRWGSYSLLYTTATSCMLHAACTCLEMSCGRGKVVSLASHKNWDFPSPREPLQEVCVSSPSVPGFVLLQNKWRWSVAAGWPTELHGHRNAGFLKLFVWCSRFRIVKMSSQHCSGSGLQVHPHQEITISSHSLLLIHTPSHSLHFHTFSFLYLK